jgi:DNA polymerase-3 subunit delta
VLLVGDEEVRRRRALDGVLEAVGASKDDFDLETFDGDSSSPMEWLASCGTAPFLGERRIAVVRHIYRFDYDKLKSVDLGRLPPTALLVLVADEEAGADEKIQRLKTTGRKAWEKAVKAADGHVQAFDPDPAAAKEELKKALLASEKTMTDRATDALVEMTGGNLGRTLDELEKLVLYVGAQPQITENDIWTVVVPSREWNVFKMVDSIAAGAVPDALRQLRNLVGSSTKTEDAAFSRILPSVSKHLRLLWQARLCVEAKCGPGNAPTHVLAQFPDKPNLLNESPYRQNSLMQGARKFSLPQIQRCFTILSDTDSRLKGGLDSFSSIDTLERMILEMSEALRGN